MMLALQSPQEAYRRIDFDARIAAAGQGDLVRLCLDQLSSAIGTALHAQDRSDNLLKSQSLARALAAITALQLGVSGQGGVAAALHQFYGGARRTLLDCVPDFDPARLTDLRADIGEIAGAMAPATG